MITAQIAADYQSLQELGEATIPEYAAAMSVCNKTAQRRLYVLEGAGLAEHKHSLSGGKVGRPLFRYAPKFTTQIGDMR